MDVMNSLCSKLHGLKLKVKVWTREETRKQKATSTKLEGEINALLLSSHSAILTREQQLRLNALKSELQKIWDFELNSAKLQSRVTWANFGDANTKFFHAVALARKNQNAIWSL